MREKVIGYLEPRYIFWKNSGNRLKTCFSAPMDVFCALLTGKLELHITMKLVSSVPCIREAVIGYLEMSYVFHLGMKMAAVQIPALVRLWTCVVYFYKILGRKE